MSWIVAVVWLFVGPDMDAKVFNYGKKYGKKDVR
jgi:3-dehydrosphinganine reductase